MPRVVALELPYDGTPYGAEALDGVAAYGLLCSQGYGVRSFSGKSGGFLCFERKDYEVATDHGLSSQTFSSIRGNRPSDKEFCVATPLPVLA